MAGYKLVVEGYQFQISVGGQTGTKNFIEDTSGPDNLPLIGDPWSAAFPFLICQTLTQTYKGDDPDHEFWTAEFSTREAEETDDPRKSLDISAELIPILPKGQKTWGSGGPDVVDTTYFRVITGTLRREKFYYLGWDDFFSKFKLAIGRVNDATWESFPAGHWMYVGASAEQGRDADGDLIIRADHTFELKYFEADKGWNYQYRPQTDAFEEIVPNLYPTVDFDIALGL